MKISNPMRVWAVLCALAVLAAIVVWMPWVIGVIYAVSALPAIACFLVVTRPSRASPDMSVPAAIIAEPEAPVEVAAPAVLPTVLAAPPVSAIPAAPVPEVVQRAPAQAPPSCVPPTTPMPAVRSSNVSVIDTASSGGDRDIVEALPANVRVLPRHGTAERGAALAAHALARPKCWRPLRTGPDGVANVIPILRPRTPRRPTGTNG